MAVDFKSLLEAQRISTADLLNATYVRPHGRGTHVVRLANGQDVIVASAVGDVTFAPGETVLLGTRAGDRARVLLGKPAAIGLGSAVFGSGETSSSTTTSVVVLSSIPDELQPDTDDQEVYMVGIGFTETPVTEFRAVEWVGGQWQEDADVTIDTPTWISDPASEGISVADGVDVIKVLVDVGSVGIGYRISVEPMAGTP